MTKQKIDEYVQKWMDGHEPDTFVKNNHGVPIYSAGASSLNIQTFFEMLLEDFINDDEVVLPQANVIKSVCEHEYITEANWRHLTCRKCNDRIEPKQTVL